MSCDECLTDTEKPLNDGGLPAAAAKNVSNQRRCSVCQAFAGSAGCNNPRCPTNRPETMQEARRQVQSMYEIRGQDAPSPAQWETVAEIEADLADTLIQMDGAGIPDDEREHYHSLVEQMEEIRAQDTPSPAEWETVAEIEEELAGMFERHTLARYQNHQDRQTAIITVALDYFQKEMRPCPDCGGSGYWSDGKGGGEECGCMGWEGLDLTNHPIATGGGRLKPLSAEEVNDLCEVINAGKSLHALDDRERATVSTAVQRIQDKLTSWGELRDTLDTNILPHVSPLGKLLRTVSTSEIDAMAHQLSTEGNSTVHVVVRDDETEKQEEIALEVFRLVEKSETESRLARQMLSHDLVDFIKEQIPRQARLDTEGLMDQCQARIGSIETIGDQKQFCRDIARTILEKRGHCPYCGSVCTADGLCDQCDGMEREKDLMRRAHQILDEQYGKGTRIRSGQLLQATKQAMQELSIEER